MPSNVQTHCNFPVPLDTNRLKRHGDWLLSTFNLTGHSLSIVLVNDREMAEFNERYRNRTGPTNVLSFPFADGTDPPLETLPIQELGDIIISVETAWNEATEYGQTFRHRMGWLLTHGFLHLVGYDHERGPEAEREMLEKEQQLLSEFATKRRQGMTKLAINVDHVATIRQARGITEPDPVTAAAICELAGASGIVVHLREDRRHIQDRDVRLLRQTVKTKLNLEMGANPEIIDIALDIKPDLVTLVPEKREELTTEGGLDVLAQKSRLAEVIGRMGDRGIPVSIFADPDIPQLEAAQEVGAAIVELHTGRYSDAEDEQSRQQEFETLVEAAEAAAGLGLRVCAGHGLNYTNTAPVAAIDVIEELSIGHSVISRAVFCGLDQAVREMLEQVRQGDLLP